MIKDGDEREQTDLQYSGSVARDTSGRIYSETRFGNPPVQNKQPTLGPFNGKAGVNVIYSMRSILDCGGGKAITIYPDQEIALVEEGPPREPDHTSLFETLAYMQRPLNTIVEDLGYKDMEGFATHGFRVTVLGTQQDGEWNGKPTNVTEAWVSDDLATVLLETRKNLRSKFDSTDALSHIRRQEPDTKLFQIPVAYKINPPPEENPPRPNSKKLSTPG
jgi:hypothetical protein